LVGWVSSNRGDGCDRSDWESRLRLSSEREALGVCKGIMKNLARECSCCWVSWIGCSRRIWVGRWGVWVDRWDLRSVMANIMTMACRRHGTTSDRGSVWITHCSNHGNLGWNRWILIDGCLRNNWRFVDGAFIHMSIFLDRLLLWLWLISRVDRSASGSTTGGDRRTVHLVGGMIGILKN